MADTKRKAFPGRAWGAIWPWMLEKVFEHSVAIITILFGSGVMAYLAAISEFLRPYAPLSYGVVFLLSLLVFSVSYAIYSWAASRTALVRYARHKTETFTVNVLSPIHEDERIDLMSFYHPFFRKTENARFENCELYGPAYVLFDGCRFDTGIMSECEIVIVRPDRGIKGVTVFCNCTFLRCNFYRVTFLMAFPNYQNFPDGLKRGMPVISDGRVGNI